MDRASAPGRFHRAERSWTGTDPMADADADAGAGADPDVTCPSSLLGSNPCLLTGC